ncbi:MAG: hypothetical protein ACAH11_04125 [Sphingomonas sp.]
MLQADLLPDFDGADTLLLWADAAGIGELRAAITALSGGDTSHIRIGGEVDLAISRCEANAPSSTLSRSGEGLEWICSQSTLDDAAWLIAALDDVAAGHQYVDIRGLAAQAIISKGEYSVRPQPQHGPGKMQ